MLIWRHDLLLQKLLFGVEGLAEGLTEGLNAEDETK
jgi:hypothetical protein